MSSNPRQDQNANERRLSSVIGMGKIVEVRLEDYTARVKDGDLVTGWLRMGMMRAFGAEQTWPYTVGEEVGYATISGDAQEGFILCALANGESPAHPAANDLKIHSTGNIQLVAEGNVTIQAARIDLN
ncbi:phage baseplate assembly protein V [Leisingera sp. MMG026]|uniref:phage baseplate assembly protein V n=1 Tax=Leisingera sp. MMG026 TaxID=2909982 RepID=UPI001F20C1D3|nr:phage baseplate assembly protein V [Leisingera sp. MMG026]MCF6432661.1 phage baseplate assembly protein V [Leisingera sp. MMG026]